MLPTYNVYYRDKGNKSGRTGDEYRAFKAGTQNDKAMAANQHWRKVATYENVTAKKAVVLARETNAAFINLAEVIN